MEAFEKLVSMLDYPMYVVTTRVGDESAGCLVGFTSQVSIGPPRFLVGLSEKNHTYRVAQGRDHLAVHLVPRHAPRTGPAVRQRDRRHAPTSSRDAPGIQARMDCRSSTTPRDGSSARCSAATTSAITSAFC